MKSFGFCGSRRSAKKRATRDSPGSRSRPTVVGHGRSFTVVAALVDTNVLVYRVDPRDPGKQNRAQALLEELVASDQCRIPHQALVEFYAVTTRSLRGVGRPLLESAEARSEVEALLLTTVVLYPNEGLFRLALHCKDAYGPLGLTPTCSPMPNSSAAPPFTRKTSKTAGTTGR